MLMYTAVQLACPLARMRITLLDVCGTLLHSGLFKSPSGLGLSWRFTFHCKTALSYKPDHILPTYVPKAVSNLEPQDPVAFDTI